MKLTRLLVFASALAIAACSPAATDTNNQAAAQQAPGTQAGIVLASMDTNVRPGDDFFAYANGKWVANTQIPADRSSIGGFYIADQERERQTRELLNSILEANPTGGNEALIANYYRAYLDTAAIDRAGMAPAQADIQAIGNIGNVQQLSAAIGSTLRADTDPLNATNFQTENLFGIFVTQGLNTPGETLPYLMQGGIGLPEREYYISGDARMSGLRDQYKA